MEKQADNTKESQDVAPNDSAQLRSDEESVSRVPALPDSRASSEESDALVYPPAEEIQPDIPANSSGADTGAVEKIETEDPNSASVAGRAIEVESGVASGSAVSKAVVETERSEMGPQLFSRRRAITLGVSLAAGLAAAFWSPLSSRLLSFWQSSTGRRRLNPYFRLNKLSAVYAPVELDEGFYARKTISDRRAGNPQRRNIIHYVDSKKRVPFLKRLDARSLRPALNTELAVDGFTLSTTKTPRFPATHVSLGHASALFELAALQKLQMKEYGPACELLINGIRHDLAFKHRVVGAPSLRLLDLLAIVSIRQNQPEHFSTLVKLAGEAMKLIDQQSVGPAASRKPKRKRLAIVPPPRPSKKEEPQDNQRKRRRVLDAAAHEVARGRRRAVLQTRLENWKNLAWQKKRKELKRVKWAMTIPPGTIKDKNEKFRLAI